MKDSEIANSRVKEYSLILARNMMDAFAYAEEHIPWKLLCRIVEAEYMLEGVMTVPDWSPITYYSPTCTEDRRKEIISRNGKILSENPQWLWETADVIEWLCRKWKVPDEDILTYTLANPQETDVVLMFAEDVETKMIDARKI